MMSEKTDLIVGRLQLTWHPETSFYAGFFAGLIHEGSASEQISWTLVRLKKLVGWHKKSWAVTAGFQFKAILLYQENDQCGSRLVRLGWGISCQDVKLPEDRMFLHFTVFYRLPCQNTQHQLPLHSIAIRCRRNMTHVTCRHSAYTGFMGILLTPDLVSVLNQVSQK